MPLEIPNVVLPVSAVDTYFKLPSEKTPAPLDKGSIVQKLFDAYKLYRIHLKYSFIFSTLFTLRLVYYAIFKKIKISYKY